MLLVGGAAPTPSPPSHGSSAMPAPMAVAAVAASRGHQTPLAPFAALEPAPRDAPWASDSCLAPADATWFTLDPPLTQKNLWLAAERVRQPTISLAIKAFKDAQPAGPHSADS